MAEMCLIHNNYDRIVDKVMWLGFGAVLNFNIDLYYTRKDANTGERIKENFHKEILYKNNNEEPYKVKIVRDFTYYFSIEINTKNIKDRIIIGPNEIYFIIFNLKNVMKWFIGDNGINNIFKKQNSRIIIPTHPNPIKITLPFNSYIEFDAAVENINGYDTIGTRVYLNNDSTFFFMTSDVLFSLYHMLSTCNMYALAQNMLNYIARPDYGTNSFNMVTGKSSNGDNVNMKKSFFDRIGAKDANNPEGI